MFHSNTSRNESRGSAPAAGIPPTLPEYQQSHKAPLLIPDVPNPTDGAEGDRRGEAGEGIFTGGDHLSDPQHR